MLGQSGAIDITEVSSGRTNIWANTIDHMTDEPLTFLTGFGWNVYDTRFVYATHNYYLDLLFNLGLIGLLAFVAILFQAVKTARAAVDLASEEMRPYMIALVLGMMGLAVNILFTNLSKAWPYIWLYMGLTLSAAAKIIADTARRREAVPALTVASTVVRGAR
jgi:O-antigen ligase